MDDLILAELEKTRIAVQYLANCAYVIMWSFQDDPEDPPQLPFPVTRSSDPASQSKASEPPCADGASAATPEVNPSLDSVSEVVSV